MLPVSLYPLLMVTIVPADYPIVTAPLCNDPPGGEPTSGLSTPEKLPVTAYPAPTITITPTDYPIAAAYCTLEMIQRSPLGRSTGIGTSPMRNSIYLYVQLYSWFVSETSYVLLLFLIFIKNTTL